MALYIVKGRRKLTTMKKRVDDYIIHEWDEAVGGHKEES